MRLWRGRLRRRARSALDFEILGGRFSPIGDFVVFDGLALIEAAEAGFLDCGDMDEHVLSAAALRLNKPVPLFTAVRFVEGHFAS